MRSLFAYLRALLMLPLLAVVTPAAAGDFVNTAALDTLFAELVKAPDAAAAEAITQTIWAYWTNPTEPTLAADMTRALAAETRRDYIAALALLDRIVVDYPGYAEGWNRRATIYFEVHRYADSLADIEKVLALEPRHFGALSGRVMIELTLGDRPAALKDMVAALAIHPYLGMKLYFPELNVPVTNI